MRKILLTLTVVLAIPFAACGGGDDGDTGSGSDPCVPGCEATMAAACTIGPASQEECESDCRSFAGGNCAEEYSALQSCSEGKAVTCSEQGVPTIEGCDSQQGAFVACLSG